MRIRFLGVTETSSSGCKCKGTTNKRSFLLRKEYILPFTGTTVLFRVGKPVDVPDEDGEELLTYENAGQPVFTRA